MHFFKCFFGLIWDGVQEPNWPLTRTGKGYGEHGAKELVLRTWCLVIPLVIPSWPWSWDTFGWASLDCQMQTKLQFGDSHSSTWGVWTYSRGSVGWDPEAEAVHAVHPLHQTVLARDSETLGGTWESDVASSLCRAKPIPQGWTHEATIHQCSHPHFGGWANYTNATDDMHPLMWNLLKVLSRGWLNCKETISLWGQ